MSVQVTSLPTGLAVVTETTSYVKTAAIGVFVEAGSRYEHVSEHGLSHFIEHMAFKGTRRRSAREIAETIENVGGDLNAETGVERTSYFARVLAEDAELVLDVIGDLLTESAFAPEELEREKNVVVQEIGAVDDTPDDLVFDLLTTTAFPDQPIGRPILGTREGRRVLRPGGDRSLSGSPLQRRRHRRRRGRSGRTRSYPRSCSVSPRSASPNAGSGRSASRLSRRRDQGEATPRADACRGWLRGACFERA